MRLEILFDPGTYHRITPLGKWLDIDGLLVINHRVNPRKLLRTEEI